MLGFTLPYAATTTQWDGEGMVLYRRSNITAMAVSDCLGRFLVLATLQILGGIGIWMEVLECYETCGFCGLKGKMYVKDARSPLASVCPWSLQRLCHCQCLPPSLAPCIFWLLAPTVSDSPPTKAHPAQTPKRKLHCRGCLIHIYAILQGNELT